MKKFKRNYRTWIDIKEVKYLTRNGKRWNAWIKEPNRYSTNLEALMDIKIYGEETLV